MAMLYQDDPNLERRRQLAQAMMARGQQQGPVQHWTQGADRIANSLIGAYQNKKANEESQKGRQQFNQDFNAALGTGDMEQLAQVLASGGNQGIAAQIMMDMQKQKTPAADPFGKLNPSEYTPESLATFQQSRNYGDLVPQNQTASAPFAKINTSDYTPESLQRFQRSGDYSDLKLRQGGPSAEGPGQTQVDKEFAKEYVKWNASGGYADTQKQIGQLKEAQAALESGANITGPAVGRVPDWMRNIVNPESIETREAVEEVVQRNLREVLGAQFTEKEGERLIKRAYNDNLSEAENAKRVGRLITQIETAARQKADAMSYFEKNGTLSGWEGSLPTMSDFTSINFDGTADASIDDLVNQYAD